jgi:hypothetical protein
MQKPSSIRRLLHFYCSLLLKRIRIILHKITLLRLRRHDLTTGNHTDRLPGQYPDLPGRHRPGRASPPGFRPLQI